MAKQATSSSSAGQTFVRRVLWVLGASLGVTMLTAFGPPRPWQVQRVTVNEGTNLAATISPDQGRVVVDLQGSLYVLSSAGGTAKRLTDPLLEPARPHWSPTGELLAFQAYAGGTFHIWTSRPDGSGLRQLTSGHGDDREPRFSKDGKRIAFSSDRAFEGTYDIWVVELASGALSRWTSAKTDEFEPTWLSTDEVAYVVGTGNVGTSIQASKLQQSARTLATAPAGSRLNAPSAEADGQRIAYTQFANNQSRLLVSGTVVGSSSDVFPFHASWLSDHELLYTADGHIRVTDLNSAATRTIALRAEIELVREPYAKKRHDFDSRRPRAAKGIVGPTLSPDGKSVLFQALNQIWILPLGGRPRAITQDAYYKTDPAWSPDGRQIAYSSDKAGTEDLYILDVASGQEQRLTSLPGAEVSAAWSADGSLLAFQDHTNATYTVERASGVVRQVIAPLFAPSKPSFHKSGRTLAVGALKPYTVRFREGTSQILTVDLETLALTYTEPPPFKSLSTRGEDGPVYAPDGTAVAFVVESVLWVRPVDASGVPTGEARQLTQEATDAPSWRGDSSSLLYLSNGKLRQVAREGGTPSDVPLELRWSPQIPSERVVVHAGKLWDGRGAEVYSDVDLVLAGHRIERIGPHRDPRTYGPRVRHIDASKQTVIPGLWESHTHEWISGKFYGDRLGRLWLSYGVTSLNSLGDPAYRAVETREAFSSGARVGPRFFATGEAIDGERVYYNFMRPTTGGDAQLARELSRAKALDYDMIKTYVRLTHQEQAKVVDFAHHELGVYVASHYNLPGMAYGVDGMSHVSATTRTGFAYTRSSAGVSYQDIRELFRSSGEFIVSTTFNAALYADEPGLVDDERLLALNTPWDQALLRAKRDTAVSTDQTVPLDTLRKEEATVASILAGKGVPLAGTDSPIDNVATALHLNLRAQVKAGGLAPWQALQTATKLPAEAFGVGEDLGTIEPGKLADLALIEGEPLVEIRDVARVRSVIKNGVLYTREELLKPFSPGGVAVPQQNRSPAAERAAKRFWWHDPGTWVEDDHH